MGLDGNLYAATTTLDKMRRPGFDIHARLHKNGWLIVQEAFDPSLVDHTRVMDRIAEKADGAFDEITNDKVDNSRGSLRKQIPAPTKAGGEGPLQTNVNILTRDIVDEAVR